MTQQLGQIGTDQNHKSHHAQRHPKLGEICRRADRARKERRGGARGEPKAREPHHRAVEADVNLAEVHSALMPASFTTVAQRFTSSAIWARSASGVLGVGVAPCLAKLSCTSRASRAWRKAVLRRATAGCTIPG